MGSHFVFLEYPVNMFIAIANVGIEIHYTVFVLESCRVQLAQEQCCPLLQINLNQNMSSKDCWDYSKKTYKGTGVTFNKMPTYFGLNVFITMGNTVFNSN